MLLELRITLIKLLKLPLMTGKRLISFMLNLRNRICYCCELSELYCFNGTVMF